MILLLLDELISERYLGKKGPEGGGWGKES